MELPSPWMAWTSVTLWATLMDISSATMAALPPRTATRALSGRCTRCPLWSQRNRYITQNKFFLTEECILIYNVPNRPACLTITTRDSVYDGVKRRTLFTSSFCCISLTRIMVSRAQYGIKKSLSSSVSTVSCILYICNHQTHWTFYNFVFWKDNVFEWVIIIWCGGALMMCVLYPQSREIESHLSSLQADN